MLKAGRLQEQSFPNLDRMERLHALHDDECRRASWKRCPECGKMNVWNMSPTDILEFYRRSSRPREHWPETVRQFESQLASEAQLKVQ
ncbi:MAG: hypothetical protein FWD53_03640 [Phycisphaerales bacterium]|nr:hypothetical protein [Phycisphaerales bacterium]